jgi:hypothetical protein
MSDARDDTGRLMPGDDGEGHVRADAADRLVVGLAEAARPNAHEHLARSRLRNRHILQDKAIYAMKNGS